MSKILLSMFLGLVVLGLSACSSGATHQQLRDRAAFDFDCPDEQLEVHEIDDRTIGVRGCGSRATYVEDCETCEAMGNFSRCNCTWVLNTDGRSDDRRVEE